MNFNSPSLVLAVAMCVTLTACDRKADTSAPAAPSASRSADAPSAAPAQADASAKLNGYIDCFNQLDGSAERTIARYSSWVKDMKVGPTGKERVVYGLYSMNSDAVTKCRTTFAQAAAMKPAMATLDAAGKAYIEALSALDKAVAEAYPYYDRENYKDDKFAKGKELHTLLAASFDAFSHASTAFSQALETENDAVLEAQLAEVEKTEGRKATYFQMALMRKAKQLAATIGEEDFDAAKAGEQLAAYEKITDEALAYAKAHREELSMKWTFFESATENMRKAAKERVRRVRDRVPYSEGERMMLKPGSGWMVEGSVEKAIKAYNDLVSASNNL